MTASNKFVAGIAAAAMVLALVSTPAPGQQPSPQQQQQAFQAEQQRQQAAAEAQTRAMLQRDLQVGNMTPAQQEALGRYAQERLAQAVSQAPSAVAGAQRNVQTFIDNTQTNLDRNSRAIDPANADSVTNRQFGEAVAHTGVDLVTDANNMRLNTLRDLRPVVMEIGAASADIARERLRIIQSNGVSAEELQRVQGETQRVTRAVDALPTHMDEAEMRIRSETQRARESETRIAQRVEQTATQYGRDPANIPPGADGPRRYDVPTPTARPAPAQPDPVAPPPSSTPPSRTASSGSASQRGTIPGDPDAGLTVPRSQGGTGPETAETRAAAQAQAQARTEAQARTDAQSQAERNAARTEELRQQAMDRARQDNEDIDAVSGAMNAANSVAADALRAEAQAEAEINDLNEALRRAARPGQVGRGGASAEGGSGSGYGGGGSSDHDVIAALPGMGRDVPAGISVEEMVAMIERSRVADENYRLFQSAARQNARDTVWDAMTRERFGNGAWNAFDDGAVVTTLELEDIYRNYDLDRSPVIPPMRSLSAAGNSLSAAGNSLSAAGTAVVTGLDDYNDPAVRSLHEATRVMTTRRRNPFGLQDADNVALADRAYSAGSFQVQTDRTGRRGQESGGYVAASLYSHDDPYLRQLMNNGRTGLDRLLAQPFNVILTWGENAYDLDLHMTGPLGAGTTDRFHIYFSEEGNLESQPYAALIKDCICNAGSEVILTTALNAGGVYRVSVYNYGDPAESSSNLSNASGAQIQIVRGGTTQSVGNGTTIVGGHTILTTTVPNGGMGNTWTAVELDPKNGRITVPRGISQSNSSAEVH